MTRTAGNASALVRIVLVGSACVLGLAATYAVTVRTVPGRLFGDASLRGALLTRTAMADGADAALNVVSVASLLGAVALVSMIALLQLERSKGLAAVGLLVGANVSTLLLKRYLLERPDLGLSEVSPATLNSLPSGHTTAIFSAVAALLIVIPFRWRYRAALAGLLVSTVIALATMSAGWHRAGDSMAAFLVVGVWASVAAGAVRIAGSPAVKADDATNHTRPARWLVLGGVGSLGVGLILGGVLSVADGVRDSSFGSALAFLVGALLIIGTGVVTLLGVLQVLTQMEPREHEEALVEESPVEESPRDDAGQDLPKEHPEQGA